MSLMLWDKVVYWVRMLKKMLQTFSEVSTSVGRGGG